MKSNFAKRQLEKYGWQEGKGLGKDLNGITSYVKASRRDPKSSSGIGHISDKNHDAKSDSCWVELSQVLEEIQTKKHLSSLSSKSDKELDSDRKSDSIRTSSLVQDGKKGNWKSQVSASCSSTSESDSEEDSSEYHLSPISDEALFKRCGGVRLGRSGRHRLFDGKFSRIEASEKVHTKDLSLKDDL